MTWRGRVVLAAVIFVVGALAGWMVRGERRPTYAVVEVPLIRVPSVDVSALGRLWWAEAERRYRAVERGGAAPSVAGFCGPVVRAAVERADSVGGPVVVPSEPIALPPEDVRAAIEAVEVTRPWNMLRPTRIDLFGMLNTGDRFHDQYETYGSGVFAVDRGDTRGRGERAGILKPVVWTAGAVAVGFGSGYGTCAITR